MLDPRSSWSQRRRFLGGALAVVAGAALTPAAAAQAAPEDPGGGGADRARIVVGFKPGVTREQRGEVLARDGAVLRRALEALRAAGATVPAADRDRHPGPAAGGAVGRVSRRSTGR